MKQKQPEVIRVVEWNGRKCEILQEYDTTCLARFEGETALFGIRIVEIDGPQEPETKRNIMQHLFNRRNKPE